MISIVVPVYNAQSTLRRCLDSILSQDYTDYEVLVINDGSKDDSPAICDEYAAKDSRFRVFHKPHGGVSSARNVGLDNARGEWITFADADDIIEEEAFHIISDSIQDNPELILENVYVIEKKDGSENRQLVFCTPITDTYTMFNSALCGAVWNKVFRKDIIERNKIRFDETLSFCEDCIFVAYYCAQIKSINYISKACYTQYLPESYSKKYNKIQFESKLSLYKKASLGNREYSCTLVDGVVMALLDDIEKTTRDKKDKKITAFKEIIGRDIIYAKGKKKFAIRWLANVNSTVIWNFIIKAYSKVLTTNKTLKTYINKVIRQQLQIL